MNRKLTSPIHLARRDEIVHIDPTGIQISHFAADHDFHFADIMFCQAIDATLCGCKIFPKRPTVVAQTTDDADS